MKSAGKVAALATLLAAATEHSMFALSPDIDSIIRNKYQGSRRGKSPKRKNSSVEKKQEKLRKAKRRAANKQRAINYAKQKK